MEGTIARLSGTKTWTRVGQRRVSVLGVFLIAMGMYHGGKNVGVALALTSGQK